MFLRNAKILRRVRREEISSKTEQTRARKSRAFRRKKERQRKTKKIDGETDRILRRGREKERRGRV